MAAGRAGEELGNADLSIHLPGSFHCTHANSQTPPRLMELTVNHGTLTGVTFNDGPFHVLRVGGNDFTIDSVKIRSVSNNYDNAYPASVSCISCILRQLTDIFLQQTDGMNIYGQRITVSSFFLEPPNRSNSEVHPIRRFRMLTLLEAMIVIVLANYAALY